MGPYVRRLVIQKMATDAIPPRGSLADALSFLSSRKQISEGMRKAETYIQAAIIAVREAAEPNPWREADDEAIAQEILRKIDERKQR